MISLLEDSVGTLAQPRYIWMYAVELRELSLSIWRRDLKQNEHGKVLWIVVADVLAVLFSVQCSWLQQNRKKNRRRSPLQYFHQLRRTNQNRKYFLLALRKNKFRKNSLRKTTDLPCTRRNAHHRQRQPRQQHRSHHLWIFQHRTYTTPISSTHKC